MINHSWKTTFMDDPAEVFSNEFFYAWGVTPTSTHEEWLLRLCSQLMHREASVIRMMEQGSTMPKQHKRNARRRGKWTCSSSDSHESTVASTVTENET